MANNDESEALLAAALGYAARDWRVVPLYEPVGGVCSCPRGEGCPSPGKHPRTKNGLHDASDDPDLIRGWWRKWPLANVGVLTGGKSGLVVLDIDGQAAELALKHSGIDLDDTLEAATGKPGGRHLYYQTGGRLLHNRAGMLEKLDLRGEGGYVVAPPSLHASGRRYEWVDPDAPLTMAPQWLIDLATRKGRHVAQDRDGGPWTTPGSIPEGERDDTLFREGCSRRAKGDGHEQILAWLRHLNQTRCHPPLSDGEVEKIARQASKYDAGDPFSSPLVGAIPDVEVEVTLQRAGVDPKIIKAARDSAADARAARVNSAESIEIVEIVRRQSENTRSARFNIAAAWRGRVFYVSDLSGSDVRNYPLISGVAMEQLVVLPSGQNAAKAWGRLIEAEIESGANVTTLRADSESNPVDACVAFLRAFLDDVQVVDDQAEFLRGMDVRAWRDPERPDGVVIHWASFGQFLKRRDGAWIRMADRARAREALGVPASGGEPARPVVQVRPRDARGKRPTCYWIPLQSSAADGE